MENMRSQINLLRTKVQLVTNITLGKMSYPRTDSDTVQIVDQGLP